jgi:hypothetical protein
MLRMLQRAQNTLPQAVGFSNQNALIITDALGKRFTLPFSIVAKYEVGDNFGILSRPFATCI